MSEPRYIDRGAVFSPDRVYRYRLWRTWDARKPRVGFVLLNPSTADEQVLDPTLRRCLGFAYDWGCGSFVVGNLYALRSTDPGALKTFVGDPVGPENDAHLAAIAHECGFGLVVGWGANARRTRADAAIELLRHRRHLLHLGLTKSGFPRHPLYVKRSTRPVLYRKHSGASSNGRTAGFGPANEGSSPSAPAIVEGV